VGTVVLVLAGWRVLARLAKRHADADPRARSKVFAAVGFSLALGLGGFALLAGFEAKSEVGIHATFVKAVNQTVGEGDYLENVKLIAPSGKPAALAIQRDNLAKAEAALVLNPSNQTAKKEKEDFTAAIQVTQTELGTAQANVRLLTPNHQVWLLVQPHLAVRTDAEDAKAREILDAALDPARVAHLSGMAALACTRDVKTGACVSAQPAAIKHSYRDLHTLSDVPVAEGVPEAFKHKEEFRAQMKSTLAWFVYPGVSGLFLAPFAFAGGSILNAAFEPSDSVGYKPYPGKAAGWFLLLGAFGLFAIPFGAWTLRDLHKRSIEGQIAL
jgi:hypothetical protein